MTSHVMLDSASPPPVETAKGWIDKYGLKAFGTYVGGRFLSPNSWTPALAEAYRKAGIELLGIYVGSQAGIPGQTSLGIFTVGQGSADGLDAVDCARKFGFTSGYIALDVESQTVDNAPTLREYVKAWCVTVEADGFYPGVYAPPRFVSQLEGTACAFVWVAEWKHNAGQGVFDASVKADSAPGVDAKLWPKKRIWQYDNGTLDGVGVDFDAINFELVPTDPKAAEDQAVLTKLQNAKTALEQAPFSTRNTVRALVWSAQESLTIAIAHLQQDLKD